MPNLKDCLRTTGICRVPDLYGPDDVARLNTVVDPHFAALSTQPRSYVYMDDMHRLGILELVFSQAMRSLLFSIVPDPQLYHCHIYEIAANNKTSHIFSESLSGWHCDPDSEFANNDPTHVSVFVYLTDVGPEDGPFEFIPQNPTNWLHSKTACLSVTGNRGLAFVWNRSYYHRASPNRGPVRRRLLKISVQPQRFPNEHIKTSKFTSLMDVLPAGDTEMDMLLGRYAGSQPIAAKAESPTCSTLDGLRPLGISNGALAKAQLRMKAKALKARLLKPEKQAVAYD
jgi:hypothetical protein